MAESTVGRTKRDRRQQHLDEECERAMQNKIKVYRLMQQKRKIRGEEEYMRLRREEKYIHQKRREIIM